ncbi:MAG: flagellar hook-length control protein FliK [Comamonas sp.]
MTVIPPTPVSAAEALQPGTGPAAANSPATNDPGSFSSLLARQRTQQDQQASAPPAASSAEAAQSPQSPHSARSADRADGSGSPPADAATLAADALAAGTPLSDELFGLAQEVRQGWGGKRRDAAEADTPAPAEAGPALADPAGAHIMAGIAAGLDIHAGSVASATSAGITTGRTAEISTGTAAGITEDGAPGTAGAAFSASGLQASSLTPSTSPTSLPPGRGRAGTALAALPAGPGGFDAARQAGSGQPSVASIDTATAPASPAATGPGAASKVQPATLDTGTAGSAPAPLAAAGTLAALAPDNGAQAPSSTASSATALSSPLGSTAWASELGQQLAQQAQWQGRLAFSSHHPQQVELQLNPADLGPLHIVLSVSDGVAQAAFASPHAAVRSAVESALPQLQQALASAGLSLGQASVGEGQGQSAEQPSSQDARGRADGQATTTADATAAESAPARPLRAHALLDTFA